MSTSTNSSFDIAMDDLRLQYLSSLSEREEALYDFLMKLAMGILIQSDFELAAEVAHNLAGTGATYGLPDITDRATELEDYLGLSAPIDLEHVKTLTENLLDTCSAARSRNVPVRPSTAAPSVKEITVQPPTKPLINARVIIVDDDKNAQDILRQLLGQSANCSVFSSADDAYAAIEAVNPHLILLDDKMPGSMSGYELLQRIKSERRFAGIEVIMITAVDEPTSVLRSLSAGAADYIVKPFDPNVVGRKLRLRMNRLSQSILLVEDDDSTLNMLLNKFRSKGYPCSFARDGVQALEILKTNPPSLVVLDRMMPGLDGLALLQMIRQFPSLRSLPVVMLSAKRLDKDIQAGLEQGATDYVVKPFNIDELVLRCEKLLGEQGEQATH